MSCVKARTMRTKKVQVKVKTDLHFPISNECAEIMTNKKREHEKWKKEGGRERIGARQRQRN